MENWCFVVTLSLLLGKGQTFPNSAPYAACIDLVPGHIPTNEVVINPFILSPETGVYAANEILPVTILGLNEAAVEFKGLLLQARRVDTREIIGTWEQPTTPGLTTLSCSNTNDAITHSDGTIKTTPVWFNWVAPASDVGLVQFVATIVQEYSVFWVAISSYNVRPSGTSLCDFEWCRNAGSCFPTSSGYMCSCPIGFSGELCEIFPGSTSSCVPNPCQNNGQCYDTAKCACATGSSGEFCQLSIPSKVFCTTNTCQNDGRCIVDQASGQYCVCRVGYRGATCEHSADPCIPDPCINNGVCVNEEGGYRCVCPPTHEGINCETGVNPCEGLTCLNGGQCVTESTSFSGYRCSCPRTHTGSRCETSVCTPNPCRNGGACNLLGTVVSGYQCECTSSFTGPTCQTAITDGPCGSDSCGSGSCIVDAGAEDGFRCNCPSTHTGALCQDSVCGNSPCHNGGLCVLDHSLPHGYLCDCPLSYTGDNCENRVVCSPNPCQNGGACSSDSETEAGYRCNCLPTYIGDDCQTVNPCNINPCFNSGECVLTNTGFNCNCVDGFTGVTCQTPPDFCSPNPCVRGECVSNPSDFTCVCMAGYTGRTCNVPPPDSTDVVPTMDPEIVCIPNPCLNDGDCYVNALSPTGFNCTCKELFFGIICESEVLPCDLNDPCENDGQCIDDDLSCQCTPEYRGNVCQFPVSANCSDEVELCIYGQCVNVTDGYRCDCEEGATGLNCEDKDPCIPTPCAEQGTCRALDNGDITCDCTPGFTGDTCDKKESGTLSEFLELVFTYWPVALGILVVILIIIICWIGCHFTNEEKKKKAEAADKILLEEGKGKKSKRRGSKDKKGEGKKSKRQGSEDEDSGPEGTYQI